MLERVLLEIRTGCRLHFGLMELADGEPLRFGGLGLMLDQPHWKLRLQHSETLQVTAATSRPHDELFSRIRKVLQATPDARRTTAKSDCPPPTVSVEVLEQLPMHSGLGAGTQLACAVAAGRLLADRLRGGQLQPVAEWTPIRDALPDIGAQELAASSGRGLRSGVGLRGFLDGGFILDQT